MYYLDLDGAMMAVSVTTSPTLSLGPAMRLFDWEKPPKGASDARYDMSPVDGRFLMTKSADDAASQTVDISVVLNWFEELRERVTLRTR